jgi:hypothetical protein
MPQAVDYPTTKRPSSIVNQARNEDGLQTEGDFARSAPASSVVPDASTAPGLSQEDARFFNSLYALNVPSADIATMIEALRAEREANNLDGSRGTAS